MLLPSRSLLPVALARIDWPRSDPRWYSTLENALYIGRNPDRALLRAGFRLTLNRCDRTCAADWCATILHAIAASRGGLTADDRLAFAITVLEAGGRLDFRDNLLKPLRSNGPAAGGVWLVVGPMLSPASAALDVVALMLELLGARPITSGLVRSN